MICAEVGTRAEVRQTLALSSRREREYIVPREGMRSFRISQLTAGSELFCFFRYMVCLAVGYSEGRKIAFQSMHGLAPSSSMSSAAAIRIQAALPTTVAAGNCAPPVPRAKVSVCGLPSLSASVCCGEAKLDPRPLKARNPRPSLGTSGLFGATLGEEGALVGLGA